MKKTNIFIDDIQGDIDNPLNFKPKKTNIKRKSVLDPLAEISKPKDNKKNIKNPLENFNNQITETKENKEDDLFQLPKKNSTQKKKLGFLDEEEEDDILSSLKKKNSNANKENNNVNFLFN